MKGKEFITSIRPILDFSAKIKLFYGSLSSLVEVLKRDKNKLFAIIENAEIVNKYVK